MSLKSFVLAAVVLSLGYAQYSFADAVTDGLIKRRNNADNAFQDLTKARAKAKKKKDQVDEDLFNYSLKEHDDSVACGDCRAEAKGCNYADFIPTLAGWKLSFWNSYLTHHKEAKDSKGDIVLTTGNQKMNEILGFTSEKNSSCSVLYAYAVTQKDAVLASIPSTCQKKMLACPTVKFKVKLAVLDQEIAEIDQKITVATERRDGAADELHNRLTGADVDSRTLIKGETTTHSEFIDHWGPPGGGSPDPAKP